MEYVRTVSAFLRVFAECGQHGDGTTLRLIYLEKSAQELAAIFTDGPRHLQQLQPDLVSLGLLLVYLNDPPRTFGASEEQLTQLLQGLADTGNPPGVSHQIREWAGKLDEGRDSLLDVVNALLLTQAFML